MPLRGWKSELLRFAVLLSLAAFFGLLLDAVLWCLLAATLAYALWSLNQLRLLNRWLSQDSDADAEPPEAGGLWGRVFDLLAQKQREQSRLNTRLRADIEHLRSSFSSMADAVVMLAPDGSIEWSNRAARTLLGLRQPDDNGRLLVNLIRAPAFIAYFESGDYQEHFTLVSPINSQIHLSVSISVFGRDNRLLFARDISRTLRLEQMRKDFVANVSHELRTPLTVINGYLEMLAEQASSSSMARAVQQMTEQAKRMQGLVEDLMTLSRLEAVPIEKRVDRIPMRSLMDTLRDEIELAAAGQRQLAINCDEGLRLLGNAKELQSAFSNLAINAARYTRDGDSITLRWYADRDHAYFEIEDSGIGIEPQHLPRLTERFYRVDQSRSSETGGTGLGLAIVKHILLRHQAELRIRSQPGRGSLFSCVFPITAVQRENAA